MASIIRIKRSPNTGAPSGLSNGEMGYTYGTGTVINGGDRLYIGHGSETGGIASSIAVIGGKYFTDMLDHTPGTLTASSALVVDSSKKLDELLVDNLSLNGNTLGATGDLVLSSTTGVVLNNSEFISGGSYGGNRLYLPTGGGATLQSGYEGGVTLRASTNNTDWATVNLASSGDLTIPGTIKTLSNGDLTLAPNGTGKLVLNNPYINGTTDTLAEYIYDTVGGAITAGTGVTITNSDGANTSTVSITDTAVTAGSYGSATAIPTFTVNAQGQLTAAGTASLATTLNIAGDTGTSAFALLTDTATFVGGTGITSTVTKVGTATSVTFDIDTTVATLTGTQTLTNKTIDLTNNTLVATSAQIAAAVSDETGTGSLVFATSPTLITPTLGSALATSITATSGALLISGADGNNNVNITPTGTGTVDVGSKRITSVATPTSDTDAANKGYVDAVKTGLNVKDAARLATTAALTVDYANGTAGVGATLTNAGTLAALTLDSIPAVAGDRILIKDQSDAIQNGIYTVTNIGSAAAAWVLTRATDFDNNPDGEVGGGDFIFVQEGTSQADNGYVVTTNGIITVGTTTIDFVQFSGAGQITAGTGLTKIGNTINAVGTADRISVTSDAIDIASTYVGQSTITTLGTVATGNWSATVIAGQYGGTGVANTGKTITLGGDLITAGAFATTLTSTASTNVTLPTTGTLATLDGTEALTNKTINGLTVTNSTGTLTIVSGGTLATAGAFSTTLTSTAATNVTLPTTGTLATLAGTETLTNKTITGAIITTGSINNTPIGNTTASTGAFTTLDASGAVTVSGNITGAGAATSSLDGFNIDGGTY